MKKIITLTSLFAGLCLSSVAFANSTVIVHDSADLYPIAITYKICDNMGSTACSLPQKALIQQQGKLELTLKDKDQVVYLLNAEIKNGEALIASSQYGSRDNGGSFCETTANGFIALNTHYTNRIGCAMLAG